VKAPPLPHLRGVAALGRLAGTLRTSVHRMKYAGEAVLADALGAELGVRIAGGLALGWRVDVVVPVPLAPARARERGYDQARRLACAAGRVSGAKFVPALARRRETLSQVGLGREERAANVRGAFASAPIAGGVALVDDVLTTGATLVECARTLRRAGATEVRALVVAIET